jgi:hypothetical protein
LTQAWRAEQAQGDAGLYFHRGGMTLSNTVTSSER